MKKRLIPLMLAFFICVLLFAGCQSSELKSYSDEVDETAANGPAVTDYSPVYESYDPDTVMLTVNGYDVTWAELFYWYYSDVSSIETNYGRISWEENSFDSEKNNRDFIQEEVLEMVKLYRAIESNAVKNGVTLSDEDRTSLEETWQANIDSYGGGDEQVLLDNMKESFLTKDLYNYFNETNVLLYTLQEALYGKAGEKLDEAEILAQAEEDGYVHAKHILIMTTATDDTGASVALSDEEKAEKKQTAEELLAELQAITDPEALETRFNELIGEYSEDTGHDYYPDGYTFKTGEMMEEFETAAFALEDYKLSEIVETSYGYHIILRLPLSATATVEYASDGTPSSLANIAAQERFSDDIDTWLAECEVVYSKEFEEMDIAALFAKAVYPPEESAEPEASADPAG